MIKLKNSNFGFVSKFDIRVSDLFYWPLPSAEAEVNEKKYKMNSVSDRRKWLSEIKPCVKEPGQFFTHGRGGASFLNDLLKIQWALESDVIIQEL